MARLKKCISKTAQQKEPTFKPARGKAKEHNFLLTVWLCDNGCNTEFICAKKHIL
jgi:hypothetical protein